MGLVFKSKEMKDKWSEAKANRPKKVKKFLSNFWTLIKGESLLN
jgi:hypothetical protein